MFWVNAMLPSKIEQAYMDGSSREVLVIPALSWVLSLALDHSSRILYWYDMMLQKIERVDFQGNNRMVILDLSSDDSQPFGLALSDNVMYWSDRKNRSINKYNMSSSLREVLVRGMGSPRKLHIHDDTEVFSGSTSCSNFNGNCSHLCLPNPSGHRCFCPEGVVLEPNDPFTCQRVIRCPQLSAPFHGSLQPCSNLPGHTCQFSCDKGYFLMGSTTRTCRDNGTWSGGEAQCNVSYNEMKSSIEGRTSHYKLAGGILAGTVSLTLIIFIFICFKKLRGPTSENPPLENNQFTGVAFGDQSNHGSIHRLEMESQPTDSSVILEKLEPVNSPRQNSKESNVPKVTAGSSTSSIRKELGRDNFGIKSKQDSKLLSSLQDSGSFQERVCNRLDREKKSGVSGFHKVCSHYDVDEDKVAAVFEKYPAGPSTALLEYLAATHPQLTVTEFASVLRKIAKRSDVAKLLEEYDNQ